MTKMQKLLSRRRKLEREREEKRARIGELSLQSERTEADDAESVELQTRMTAIAREWLEVDTAIGEQGPDYSIVETRGAEAEFARTVRNAKLGRIVGATLEHRATDGAEAELQQHFNCGANVVPLVMLRSPAATGDVRGANVETRAVTMAPTHVGASAETPDIPIFNTGVAAYFGIPQPTVPVGNAAYNTLTSRPAVSDPLTTSAEVAETDGTFASAELKPKRMQASFFYRASDAAAVFGMDDALRAALSEALSEANDREIVDTLVATINQSVANDPDTAANVLARFAYGPVDGRHAVQESDIRLLVGGATLGIWGGLAAAAGEASTVANLRGIIGGLRVSPLIAAVDANHQDVLVRKGLARDMVAPIWEGVEIITDNVTKAKSGEIVVTARMHSDRAVTRGAGFARIQSQHA